MSISSLYLDAFLAVAQTEGFSAAAKRLNVTQSALSQRIKNLEDDLGLTLFIRAPTGAILTEQGERLLRYCQTRDTLEQELAHDLSISKSSEIAGSIRLASYSSVLRSALIPALQPLLEKNSAILCEFICATMPELPGLLQRAEVDFIVMDTRLDRSNIEAVVLGSEKYVMIESKKDSSRNDVFLDNDANDLTTELYLKAQGYKALKFRRSYFDDCYGIIDGVALGIGRAVMPKHLIMENKNIKVTRGSKPYEVDVILHYFRQPFYSRLHQAVVDELTKHTSVSLP